MRVLGQKTRGGVTNAPPYACLGLKKNKIGKGKRCNENGIWWEQRVYFPN